MCYIWLKCYNSFSFAESALSVIILIFVGPVFAAWQDERNCNDENPDDRDIYFTESEPIVGFELENDYRLSFGVNILVADSELVKIYNPYEI